MIASYVRDVSIMPSGYRSTGVENWPSSPRIQSVPMRIIIVLSLEKRVRKNTHGFNSEGREWVVGAPLRENCSEIGRVWSKIRSYLSERKSNICSCLLFRDNVRRIVWRGGYFVFCANR